MITAGDDASLRVEPVDDPALVARKKMLGLAQRRFEKIFREHRAGGETINAVARVVAVQRDDAIQRVEVDFGFEVAHFRLGGLLPKFAVEVFPAARMAGVVFEARGIADRINEQRVALGDFGIFLQRGNEVRQRERAFWECSNGRR